jgi:hypothetical protein
MRARVAHCPILDIMFSTGSWLSESRSNSPQEYFLTAFGAQLVRAAPLYYRSKTALGENENKSSFYSSLVLVLRAKAALE